MAYKLGLKDEKDFVIGREDHFRLRRPVREHERYCKCLL